MMTVKEAERLGIMKELERKKLTYQEASRILNLSKRQTIRIMKRYRKEGPKGVISQKKGVASPRRYSLEQKIKSVALVKERYEDFGPSFASEKLKEYHDIKVSRETLRKWLIDEGVWKPKKKKEKKIHTRRTRRSRVGELIQIDGSYHAWFEERGEKCCLLVFIDDATSRIMYCRFCKRETTYEYMEGIKAYIETYGKPQAFYSDKHSIFRVNKQEVEKGAKRTQLGRALKELKIELICAHSPQAKGRVERANGTLQNRLIKEMRLKKINTIEQGNQYLNEYIQEHNKKYSIAPEEKKEGHTPCKENLRDILALKEQRKVAKDLSIQYRNTHYILETQTPNRLIHKTVDIIDVWGKELKILWGGKEIKYAIWKEKKDNRPEIQDTKELEFQWNMKKNRKPSKRHPWR